VTKEILVTTTTTTEATTTTTPPSTTSITNSEDLPKRGRGRPRKFKVPESNKTGKSETINVGDNKKEKSNESGESSARNRLRKAKSPRKAHTASSELDPACLDMFDELVKTNKTRYIIYNMIPDVDKNVKFVVEHVGPESASIDDFMAKLPENECRESVFKVTEEKKNLVVLVSWIPEETVTKNRKLYSIHADALKLKLEGLTNEVTASDKPALKDELQRL